MRCQNMPPSRTFLAEAIADLEHSGCCVIEKLLDAPTVARLLERTLDQAAAERRHGLASCELGPGTLNFDQASPNQRVWNLLNKGEDYSMLAEHPTILAIMDHLLGKDYLLSNLSANIAGKGGERMGLHRDQMFTDYEDGPLVANVAWVLSEFTDESGATRIVPGSHLPPHREVDDGLATVAAAAPVGSAVIFDGRTVHGTGRNFTDSPRVAVLAFYCRAWIRPQENSVASIADDVLVGASDRLKELLGFSQIGPFGGLDGNNRFGKHFFERRPVIRAMR